MLADDVAFVATQVATRTHGDIAVTATGDLSNMPTRCSACWGRSRRFLARPVPTMRCVTSCQGVLAVVAVPEAPHRAGSTGSADRPSDRPSHWKERRQPSVDREENAVTSALRGDPSPIHRSESHPVVPPGV
jgi:hypothetical protein